MIPRLKPFLGTEELAKTFAGILNAVEEFEKKFAAQFDCKYAISFPYGRSALWALFLALNFHEDEIILPAYTCSVVAHAIVLSKNIPRFVDIQLDDYNMDLTQVENAISKKTKAIIATHIFGYPLNVQKLKNIVETAEKKFGHKIRIIQDCAHSFGATIDGKSITGQPDIALFGLNISKQMTSIFGGMLTTKDEDLYQTIHNWRDEHFHKPSVIKTLRRWLYLLAVYPAFYEPFYGFVYNLQYKTTMLNRVTRAYHLDEKVVFPPGYDEFMLPVEAKVGLAQLLKYNEIIAMRRETANFYHQHIHPRSGWIMPPLVEGATYSHYVIRVPDRKTVLQTAAQSGIQLGELIEYSIPHFEFYKKYAGNNNFPNSLLCSQTTINLPIYASLANEKREKIEKFINAYK